MLEDGLLSVPAAEQRQQLRDHLQQAKMTGGPLSSEKEAPIDYVRRDNGEPAAGRPVSSWRIRAWQGQLLMQLQRRPMLQASVPQSRLGLSKALHPYHFICPVPSLPLRCAAPCPAGVRWSSWCGAARMGGCAWTRSS
jgi:hypothetical protein